MTSAFLRRAATAVAIAATVAVPALTAAPSYAASSAQLTERSGTTLSIRTVHQSVSPGASTAVTGVLLVKGAGGEPGRTVTLEAKPMGTETFVPVGEAVTGEHGGVRLSVAPATATKYRWHYAGDDTTRASVSGVARVRVRTHDHPPTRLNTTLTIRSQLRVIGADGAGTIRGRLAVRRVPVQHRFVVLLSHTPDATSWAFGDVASTGPDGRVAFSVAPDSRTAYRLVFLGTPLLQPVRSAVVHVAVRPTVTIGAAPTVVDPGAATTISGVVVGADGLPVAGAPVDLLARRVGSPHGLEVVGTGTTAADGSVAITATPLRSQFYRLRVLRTETTPRALSVRVRVEVRAATSLSIRGRATAQAYAVSGVLRGGGRTLAHRPVALMALAPGATGWTQVDSALTGVRGQVKFIQELAAGTSYQLAFAGGPHLTPSTSGTVMQ